MPKLTLRQQIVQKDEAYNKLYNRIFKLHKFLVECEQSEHEIQSENPIDDAIVLINKLIGDEK